MTSKSEIVQTDLIYRDLAVALVNDEVGGDVTSRAAVDVKNRTVKVRFSSEYPVDRMHPAFGYHRVKEILDHSPGAADLGRLNDGGPVLIDHDQRQHVGVVEHASIDSDRVGRAVLRFGKSKRAKEAFNDVVDGIRRTLSFGYRVKEFVIDKANKTVTATKWEPFEITLQAVPADPTAQVGRGSDLQFETEVKIMSEDQNKTHDDQQRAIDDAVGAATRLELDRMDNIRSIGEKYECDDLAKRAIGEKTSVEDFTKIVLDEIAKRQAQTGPVTQLGLSEKEVKGYSLMRALNAAYSNDWSKAGLEAECSRTIEDEIDRQARGFFIPWEIQTRVMTVGTATAGGHLKGTDHLAGSFIDVLRSRTLMGQLGANFLTGLVGDVEIPRLDTGVTWYYLGEDVDGTLSDAVLGQVTLAPTTVSGQVPISRRLLKQSSPSVEQMLLNDLARGAAQVVDLAAFEGSGAANQPTGVMNQSGIGTVSIASFATTGNLTHAEAVEFETDVATANADLGTLAYVTTAAIRGAGKTTAIDAGSGIMLIQDNEMNGYPVYVKTNLAAKTTLFGNFEDVIIGMWGVLDVEPDKAAKAAAGGLVIRAFQDFDVAIRHAGSFSKGTA